MKRASAWFMVVAVAFGVFGFTNMAESQTLNAMTITKTDGIRDTGCIVRGTAFNYTICIDNTTNPSNDVFNVTILDTLPTGVTFVSATDGGNTDSFGAVRWDFTVVTNNETRCVQTTVLVDSNTTQQALTNFAEVFDGQEALPRSDTTLVTPLCDCSTFNALGLTKEATVSECGSALAGGQITYTLCFDNTNNACDVTGAVLVDQLPPEVVFVSASGGGVYSGAQHTVTWDLGTILAGAPGACVQVVVDVPRGTPAMTITNLATIDSTETDPAAVEVLTQVSASCLPTEPGSLLVFPLIDNINGQTILEIVNRGNSDVWLEGVVVLHPAGVTPTPKAGGFIKEDFSIHLTAKEPFFWNTTKVYNRLDADGIKTQIRSYAGLKGFCFVWAVDSKTSQNEISWNYLTGDAVLLSGGKAFSYNAYAHQAFNIVQDRILKLDGIEYCQAPSQFITQGFAAGFNGVSGTLVVCALDIDFVRSVQPEFDINLMVYNQDETGHSRHLRCYQFAQYDLAADLQLHLSQIFTPKWQLTATSTNPMWAVFFQSAGAMAWGDLVQQYPLTCSPTEVVLPEARRNGDF